MTSSVLWELHRTQTIHLRQYIMDHKKKLSSTKLYSQMCRGLSTTKHASKSAQAKVLADVFATHFTQLNGRDIKPVLEMSSCILESAMKRESGPQDFGAALLTHDAFWRELFSLMKRIAKGTERGSDGRPTEKKFIVLAVVILSIAFDCAVNVSERAQAELLVLCAKEGFFDTLDETMDVMLEEARVKRMTVARESTVTCSQASCDDDG